VLLCPTGAPELIEQRLRLFEVGRVEAFGEPVIDRRQKVASFRMAPLVAPQAAEARSDAQFPHLGLLLPGDAQRLAVLFLGGNGMPLAQ